MPDENALPNPPLGRDNADEQIHRVMDVGAQFIAPAWEGDPRHRAQ